MSPAARSRIMRAIRGKDTQPERLLRAEMWRQGLRGWRCHWRGPGGRRLDIAFTRWRVGVQVDGAFWHGHPSKWTPGLRPGYWDEKIERTIRRDRQQETDLATAGWRLVRLWEFEITHDVESATQRVVEALEAAGRRTAGS